MPYFFGLLIIPIVVVMGILSFRMLRRVRSKVDDGSAKWTDEWDPFQ